MVLRDNVPYYKVYPLHLAGVHIDLFSMNLFGVTANVMRGVRAQVKEYNNNNNEAAAAAPSGCSFLDIDVPFDENTHRKTINPKTGQLIFRLKPFYSDSIFFAETYYLTMNLTLYIRGDRSECLDHSVHYEVKWNLEKGYSVIGWNDGYYYASTDTRGTYNEFKTLSTTMFIAQSMYTTRFAALVSDWEWDEIFSSNEYPLSHESIPTGWLCARGDGNGSWFWECGKDDTIQPITYTRWAQGEPKRLDGCVYVIKAAWYSMNCSDITSAISIVEWKAQALVMGFVNVSIVVPTVSMTLEGAVTKSISVVHSETWWMIERSRNESSSELLELVIIIRGEDDRSSLLWYRQCFVESIIQSSDNNKTRELLSTYVLSNETTTVTKLIMSSSSESYVTLSIPTIHVDNDVVVVFFGNPPMMGMGNNRCPRVLESNITLVKTLSSHRNLGQVMTSTAMGGTAGIVSPMLGPYQTLSTSQLSSCANMHDDSVKGSKVSQSPLLTIFPESMTTFDGVVGNESVRAVMWNIIMVLCLTAIHYGIVRLVASFVSSSKTLGQVMGMLMFPYIPVTAGVFVVQGTSYYVVRHYSDQGRGGRLTWWDFVPAFATIAIPIGNTVVAAYLVYWGNIILDQEYRNYPRDIVDLTNVWHRLLYPQGYWSNEKSVSRYGVYFVSMKPTGKWTIVIVLVVNFTTGSLAGVDIPPGGSGCTAIACLMMLCLGCLGVYYLCMLPTRVLLHSITRGVGALVTGVGVGGVMILGVEKSNVLIQGCGTLLLVAVGIDVVLTCMTTFIDFKVMNLIHGISDDDDHLQFQNIESVYLCSRGGDDDGDGGVASPSSAEMRVFHSEKKKYDIL